MRCAMAQRQVAMAKLREASFGLVQESESDLMERFGLTSQDLPRVVAFLPGEAVPAIHAS